MRIFILFFFLICFQSKMLFAQMADIANTHELFLVFEDEFNEPQLDLLKWDIGITDCNHAERQPLSCWRSFAYNKHDESNFEFTGSKLRIVAREENLGFHKLDDCQPPEITLLDGFSNYRQWNYSTGGIMTYQSFQFGVFEIKCKFPEGLGLKTSIWLYGVSPEDIAQEIDVLEFEGDQQWNLPTNIHCDDPVTSQYEATECADRDQNIDLSFFPFITGSLTTMFHTLTLVWRESIIEWWVDGIPVRVVDISLTVPMKLILGFGVGGCPWSPSEDPDLFPFTVGLFPANYEIDYVKIWSIGPELPPCASQPDLLLMPGFYPANYLPNTTIAAKNTIITSGNAVPMPGQIWRAGNSIELNPGFETLDGQTWTAEIGDCIELFGRLSNPDTAHTFTKTDSALQVTASREPLPKSLPEANHQQLEKTKSDLSRSDSREKDSLQTEIISITPNPSADGKFNVNCNIQGVGCMKAEISVMNIVGQVIHQKEFTHYTFPVSIDLSSFPKGTYFIKIQNAEKVFVQKVVSR